jgi:hypothetical protein
MKVLVSILLVLGAIFVGWKMWVYWDEVNLAKEKQHQSAHREVNPSRLEGLNQRYEQSLQDAQGKGASNLRDWLEQAKAGGLIKDPRLAWAELDYVVMVALDNPVEAKRVFGAVKARTTEDSPVYPRIQTLSKTFD